MSGRLIRRSSYEVVLRLATYALAFLSLSHAVPANAQQRREREPNSIYAGRRAKLAAQLDGPVVLWGFTGREEISQTYVFAQEENFYYLTGHTHHFPGKTGR
jgi:hypothetical protein